MAEKAASLWLQGMADILLFSGNVGQLTEGNVRPLHYAHINTLPLCVMGGVEAAG